MPAISARANGSMRMVSIRPARLSATRGNVMTLAEPVSRKRPGRSSSSTLLLIASSRSGARWIPSMMARSRPRMKPFGSDSAASRLVRSSSVI